MAESVALKCTYNNGREGVLVGFHDTCSEDLIKWNIENGRVWCNRSECEQYYRRGFKNGRPVDPCYESVLFRDWRYGAGAWHSGPRAGKPVHLHRVGPGKFAVLTTRFRGESEAERRVVGVFRIGKVVDHPESILIADQKCRIRLAFDEARELFFWRYTDKSDPEWRTGLVRYLSDHEVARILRALRYTVRDEETRSAIDGVLGKDLPHEVEPPRSWSNEARDRAERLAEGRKYGPGGEGTRHKTMKRWVAEHPDALGYREVLKAEQERAFKSFDRVDVMFTLVGNRYVVVEVEPIDPWPGAYQAIKYQALLCAELGLILGSPTVEAVLIADSLPPAVKEFCGKYGVRVEEYRALGGREAESRLR